MVKLKKGFTLIELLAVIIILAIVALIATPIVLNIVEQSRESIRKLAVSNLANAIKQSVDNHYLKSGGQMPDITIEWIYDKDNIDYPENNVMCTDVNFDKNGALYLYNCQVDNYEKTYCYENGQVLSGNECDSDITYTDANCFEFDDSTGTITGYNYDGNKCTTDVVIPSTINSVPVEHIGYAAFIDEISMQMCFNNEGYHSVEPNYTPYDGDGFQYCIIQGANIDNPITSVFLPENIITIGGWSFGYNQVTELTWNTLPNLTTIGTGAFGFNQLTELILDDLPELTTIGTVAFMTNQLTSLTLTKLPKFTTMGELAFRGNSLTKLTLNNLPELTKIDQGTFANNELISLTISNLPELTSIGQGAFTLNQLTSVTLNNLPKLTIISDGTPFDHHELNNGAFAINQLTNLTLSDLPELTTIGIGAFAKNILTEVTLTNLPNLTSIGEGAFIKDDYSQSNRDLIEIKNFTAKSFNWSSITDSNTSNQIFETGTIIHQYGNIEVVNE